MKKTAPIYLTVQERSVCVDAIESLFRSRKTFAVRGFTLGMSGHICTLDHYINVVLEKNHNAFLRKTKTVPKVIKHKKQRSHA